MKMSLSVSSKRASNNERAEEERERKVAGRQASKQAKTGPEELDY